MSPVVSRRTAIGAALGVVGMAAVGGVGVALAGQDELLRPPGAQDETRFLKLCLKCDRCRSVCPQTCITISTLEQGLINARTPRLDFHKGYCDFCGKCADVCPTGAILPGFDEAVDRVGVAVIDEDECLAFSGSGGCRKCIEECPYEAIVAVAGVPRVIADSCNGCGICEHACPSGSLRAFSGDRKRRGINVVCGSEVQA